MPKGEEDGVKDMEKEIILFHGKTGKVTWIEFEKSIARYFEMKFGSEIGIMLWKNEMPVIEGDGEIDEDDFEEHCKEVLESITNYSPQKYAILNLAKSGFWEVEWHTKWRQKE